MNVPAGDGGVSIPSGSPEGLEPAVSVVVQGTRSRRSTT